MPPKRKALADASTNATQSQPRNAKAAKTSAKCTPAKASTRKSADKTVSTANDKDAAPKAGNKGAPKAATKSRVGAFRYSNADTLSKKPDWLNLQWPNIGDFIKDKKQDMPKDGQLIDEFCYRVSDLGVPVTEEGMELCQKLDKEYEKRDQEARGMCFYNDWNGAAMCEVFENYMKDFNKSLKKTTSPYHKWAYIEGLACFLKGADDDLNYFIHNEDGDRTREIAHMLGDMILTSFDALAEHDLFAPDSEVNNIGIISLLLLEFLELWAQDLDCEWGAEVVRACDEKGIELDKVVRKQVEVAKKDIKKWRDKYEKKQSGSEFAAGNGYKHFAEKKDWTPKDDLDKYECRMFYRWDWKLDYAVFKKDHMGGTSHDITKLPNAQRKAHTLGTKEFAEMNGIDDDSDSGW